MDKKQRDEIREWCGILQNFFQSPAHARGVIISLLNTIDNMEEFATQHRAERDRYKARAEGAENRIKSLDHKAQEYADQYEDAKLGRDRWEARCEGYKKALIMVLVNGNSLCRLCIDQKDGVPGGRCSKWDGEDFERACTSFELD